MVLCRTNTLAVAKNREQGPGDTHCLEGRTGWVGVARNMKRKINKKLYHVRDGTEHDTKDRSKDGFWLRNADALAPAMEMAIYRSHVQI